MINYIFKDVLSGCATSRPPVWLMRQAGRVLPSYKDLKKNKSFSELMNNPQSVCDVTLLPVADLDVDAAILFSDILIVPEALGMKLNFLDSKPVFDNPLMNCNFPSSQLKPDVSHFDFVYRAIDSIKQKSSVPLIGFCGAPFTVMSYMFQGVSTKTDFSDFIKFIYRDTRAVIKVLQLVEEVSIDYVTNQVRHGIDAFQLFDTYAGLIPNDLYFEIFYPSVCRILNAVRTMGVKTIYFPKGFGHGIARITPDCTDYLSIDWLTDIYEARRIVHRDIAIQGNMDPRILYADKPRIEREVLKYKQFAQENPSWIFNLGHGLLPDLPYENVKYLVNLIKYIDWNK